MSDAVVRALLAARTPSALAELKAYVPDPTKVPIRLDANEAPALLPTLEEDERKIFADALTTIEPARYPDVRANALRDALAGKLGVDRGQLVIGVGSDEVIAILLSTLARSPDARPAAIVAPSPTFVMYRISARVHGMDVIEVPLDSDWDIDDAKIIEAIHERRPAVVFLATPNNPTSGAYSLERVQRVIDAAASLDPPTVVVVDEAYLPFRTEAWSGVTGLDLLRKHGNVVVLRTLSKIGLAAFRVGWAIAHPLLATEMEKVRLPYNLPVPSQVAATTALGPLANAIDRHVRAIVEERARFCTELRRIDRVRFGRTDANFVWMALDGAVASDVVVALRNRGILVRNFPAFPDRIRVTVGTRGEDDQFLEALQSVLR
jgi:histidinol-phosphate aminotransferase